MPCCLRSSTTDDLRFNLETLMGRGSSFDAVGEALLVRVKDDLQSCVVPKQFGEIETISKLEGVSADEPNPGNIPFQRQLCSLCTMQDSKPPSTYRQQYPLVAHPLNSLGNGLVVSSKHESDCTSNCFDNLLLHQFPSFEVQSLPRH